MENTNQTRYTTKVTRLGAGRGYGCRVFFDGVLVVEARAEPKILIGAVCRDLLSTVDKMDGDKFTSAARRRKWVDGNPTISVKHNWSRE